MFTKQLRYGLALVVLLAVAVLTTFVSLFHAVSDTQFLR